jgi:predicted tellurium resistance membrane protein TerC
MVVGVKMMIHGWLKEILGEHFNLIMLAVVVGILAAGVVASLLARKEKTDVVPEM